MSLSIELLCEQLCSNSTETVATAKQKLNNVINANNETYLHVACKQNNSNVVLLLLANGAKLNVENRIGETPYRLTKPNSYVQSLFDKITVLRQFCAEVPISDENYRMFCETINSCSFGEFSAIFYSKDSFSHDLLDLAVFHRNASVVSLLAKTALKRVCSVSNAKVPDFQQLDQSLADLSFLNLKLAKIIEENEATYKKLKFTSEQMIAIANDFTQKFDEYNPYTEIMKKTIVLITNISALEYMEQGIIVGNLQLSAGWKQYVGRETTDGFAQRCQIFQKILEVCLLIPALALITSARMMKFVKNKNCRELEELLSNKELSSMCCFSAVDSDGFTCLDYIIQFNRENSSQRRYSVRLLNTLLKNCLACAALIATSHRLSSNSLTSILHLASREGLDKELDLMLQASNNAAINFRDIFEETLATAAIKACKIQILELLVAKNVNLDICGKNGDSIVITAVRSGNERLLASLLILLEKQNIKIDENTTSSELARLINKPNNFTGLTPIHVACQENRLNIVKLLCQNGATFDFPDKKGILPVKKVRNQEGPIAYLLTVIENLFEDATEPAKHQRILRTMFAFDTQMRLAVGGVKGCARQAACAPITISDVISKAGCRDTADAFHKMMRFEPRTLVEALHNYETNEPGHLAFRKGEIFLELEEKDEKGWCKGRKEGKVGYYPASYVNYL